MTLRLAFQGNLSYLSTESHNCCVETQCSLCLCF